MIITMTENAINGFFNYARAVPEDKLTWQPAEGARSALDIAQECAQSPGWSAGLLKAKKFGGFDEERMAAIQEERAQWTTVEDCERVCRERSAALFEEIRAFPEDMMEETVELPWGKKTYAWWEIMFLHYWNLTYHLGQIGYIQKMYGDHGYY